jgi:hypothetical protein
MKNKLFCGLLAMVFSMLVACSTSQKTQVVQMGDNEFTQQQLINEFAKLDQAEKEIQKKKGLNGTNVAAFLFWLPGLAYTYYDADEALKLIEQRRSHLTTIYNSRFAEKRPVGTAGKKA